MTHVSRPLIGLLAATVLVFALWVVALKPHDSGTGSGGSSSGGLGQYQSDIKAAHQAVGTSNAANARAGADPTSAPSGSTAAAHPAKVAAAKHAAVVKHAVAVKHATPAKSLPHTVAAVSRFGAVQRALRRHEVLALLFFNPAAPDDRAVNAELRTVPAHSGKVFKLAIPLSEINSYMAITNRVPVNLSPTLVLIAPNGAADEIVGYADPFEISQRVNDALAIRR
ncbi:MAG TPA: hypothetical protein VGH24_01620 [Solirubrobacteraceae bacterium]|jgi:hypothetical protein